MTSDRPRLLQLLLNIIINASKFTFVGSVTLTVRKISKNNINMFKICIEDTGTGISEEMFPHLFKLYGLSGGASEVSGNTHGIGMGLTVSRILVE